MHSEQTEGGDEQPLPPKHIHLQLQYISSVNDSVKSKKSVETCLQWSKKHHPSYDFGRHLLQGSEA